jgi:NADH-ubiquinone oxidoreductase chain 5
MTFFFNWISLLFIGFVFIISSLVIVYSDDYMFGDLNIIRFILLVLMFVVSIVFLIVSPNLISFLLGWDSLGLVSYLLVIYYQNVRSYGAGMLTVLSSRIGDFALLMAKDCIQKEYFSTQAGAAVHTEAYLPLLKSSASIRNYCCL